ncbi:MAG: phytanoyl-CoA dioxygenase family protein [Chloroflexota bacterium]
MHTIDPQKVLELKVYGFTIIDDVLPAEDIVRMREILVRAEREIGVESLHRGTAGHIANIVTLDPIFFQCVDHPKVLPYIEAIMGKDLILGSLNSRIVRPGDGDQTLHSDVPLSLHRYGTEPPIMMNTVWPLVDYTENNGATRVVPGTHQSHLKEPPPDFDVKYEIQALVPAGSVIIFNGQTWHAGGANHSSESRYAMFGHYRFGQWFRFQCDPHHEFMPEWFELLTERQKELMRMTNGLGERHGADFYER